MFPMIVNRSTVPLREECSRPGRMGLARWIASAILAALLFIPALAQAQLSAGVSGLTDDNAKGYLGPLPQALSSVLNTSIYHSGDVPKDGLHFQIGVSLMAVQFDDEDRVYKATYQGPSDLESVEVPTVIGDTGAISRPGPAGTEQYFSGGFDIDNFSVGVPQLTIGNLMGTSLTVRWVAVKLGDDSEELGDLKLFGIGGQHSISQYMPDLPIDLALGGFYQTFDIGDDLLKTTALHFDLTGSKNFGVLAPYAAIGYDSFDMDLSYKLSDGNETVDQIDVDFDKDTNAHFTVGLLADLPVVKAHIEYNLAAESAVAFGLSFGN